MSKRTLQAKKIEAEAAPRPLESPTEPVAPATPSVAPITSVSPTPPRSGFAMVAQENSMLPLMKFGKDGKWTQDDVNIDKSIMIAHVDQLVWQWTPWRDGRPGDSIVGLVADMPKGLLPPRREELGDLDSKFWERDEDGKPKEPWVYGYCLIFEDEQGRLYRWSTTSNGGLRAIGDLCGEYDRYQARGGQGLPVVQLLTGGYQHKDRRVGWVHTPKLSFLKWTIPLPKNAPAEEPDPGDIYDQDPQDDIPDHLK
jgi:hypothetical protein